MTAKHFRRLVKKSLEALGFVVYTNLDKDFHFLKEDEFTAVGKSDNEVFTLKITKIDFKTGKPIREYNEEEVKNRLYA